MLQFATSRLRDQEYHSRRDAQEIKPVSKVSSLPQSRTADIRSELLSCGRNSGAVRKGGYRKGANWQGRPHPTLEAARRRDRAIVRSNISVICL